MTRRRKGPSAQRVLTPAAAARQREASATALVTEAAAQAGAADVGQGGGGGGGGDLSRLRKLAAVRGLATNALRARLWPLLVGVAASSAPPAAAAAAAAVPLPFPLLCNNNNDRRSSADDDGGDASNNDTTTTTTTTTTTDPELQAYVRAATAPLDDDERCRRDLAVVACDVERSLWRLCPDDAERPALRAALARVLRALLATEGREEKEEEEMEKEGEDGGSNGDGHRSSSRTASARQHQQQQQHQHRSATIINDGPVRYYQGLHDVASVLLVVTRDELASFRVLRALSRAHLRDATRPTLDAVIETLTLVLPQVLKAADPELANALESAALPPFYALSWAITWFSHDVRDAREAARLFDLFLSAHPLMPLYVGAAAMRAQRARLLAIHRRHEADGEAMPRLHTALVNLDALACPGGADRLACEAIELFSALPPEEALRRAAAAGAGAGAGAAKKAAGLRLAVGPRAYLSSSGPGGGVWRVPPQGELGGGGGGGGGAGRLFGGLWTSRQAAAFLEAASRLATAAPSSASEQQQQLAQRRRPGTAAAADGGGGSAQAAAAALLLGRSPPAAALLRPVAALAVIVAAVLAALGGGRGGGPGALDVLRHLMQ